MLIEKVSGISYSQFIQQRIFDRLQMHDSGYADPSTVIPRLARGYRPDGSELRNENLCDPRSAWSAGVLYSTVGDLTRWSEAIAQNELLNADALNASTARTQGPFPKIRTTRSPTMDTASYSLSGSDINCNITAAVFADFTRCFSAIPNRTLCLLSFQISRKPDS